MRELPKQKYLGVNRKVFPSPASVKLLCYSSSLNIFPSPVCEMLLHKPTCSQTYGLYLHVSLILVLLYCLSQPRCRNSAYAHILACTWAQGN